jgi:hypothetical protein
MDSEIKQRIEMVRRGEVPEGYKKIQRDIIPKDWTIKSLAEVGNNFSYGMNAAAKAYDGHNKYIRITDIDDNTHIYTGLDLVSPHADLELKYRVQENDILFARTGATVGKTYLYNKNDGILFFAGFLIRVNIPIDNSYYVYEQTLTGRYLNWIRIMSQRSGQPGINAQEYGTYSFPYCCVKEQQKIAAILTTQDKAIELKEKRLAEKQRQKKYLMQQLLTVRKRLPGYIGEWTTLPLKYLSEKQKKKNSGFQYSLVLSNSAQHGIVLQDQEFTKEIANAERIDGYYIVVPGAFVYNPRISISAPCGPINVNETGKTGIVSPLYIVFSISAPEIDQIFLKYYFQSSCWYKYVKGVANYGARHDRISISDEDFFEMPIPLPIKDEQSAIAQVLSAADREISLLRQDIEQEKQKKKALMQLLLTGIVRVKI